MCFYSALEVSARSSLSTVGWWLTSRLSQLRVLYNTLGSIGSALLRRNMEASQNKHRYITKSMGFGICESPVNLPLLSVVIAPPQVGPSLHALVQTDWI